MTTLNCGRCAKSSVDLLPGCAALTLALGPLLGAGLPLAAALGLCSDPAAAAAAGAFFASLLTSPILLAAPPFFPPSGSCRTHDSSQGRQPKHTCSIYCPRHGFHGRDAGCKPKKAGL